MSDPAGEFRRLAEVVGAMRKEVGEALDKAAPDHRRDFAELLTELRKIERKPLLGMTAEVLERRVGNAAAEGTREAAEAFREGTRMLHAALERDERHVSRYQYFWTLGLVVALCVGVFAGTWLGTWVLPNRVIASPTGCAFIRGSFIPAEPPKRPHDACVFWSG